MKKITLLLFMFVSLCSYSQTTQIEYNYLTKGLKDAVEKGLDLKQGYDLQDFYTHNEQFYTFNFRLFVDVNTKKTKAILVVVDSKVWGNRYYVCIPQDNPDLSKQYSDYLQSWDKDILKAYSLALTDILGLSLKSI
ncbi:hypothetical protein [Flavobacterium sp.]|uniref:hypothetical protein n=1 Tax=Flavobacterium sp. TaxID=239 RepID=UPI00375115C8